MRFIYTFITFLYISVIFMSCATFKNLDSTQKDYGLKRLPTAEDFPNSDAVTMVESHLIDMNFDTNDDIYTVEEVHVVQRVFRNFDDYANVQIILDHYDRLQSIEARTINPDGKIVTLQKTDFHTATGVTYESEFISDRKAIKFAFKNVQKGSILEYKYRLLTDFRYGSMMWQVQKKTPTMLNVLKLSIPKYMVEKMNLIDENNNIYKWNWIYKAYGWDLGEPIVQKPFSNQPEDEQKYVFTWKLKKIPSYKREPYGPPFIENVGHVRFAEKTTWNGIADRYIDFFWKPQFEITAKVAEKANQIVQNAKSDLERIRLLTDYVKSIRYTALQLGDGGLRPRKPQEIMDTQYGDCKDKSMLLISMLRHYGIDAKPVLVRTYDLGYLDPDFPSGGWFNHMIVKVDLDGQALWIDATSENSQFGEIPWLDEGVWVCVLDSGKAKIEKTPARDQSENKVNITINAKLTGDTGVEFHCTIEHFGNSALYLYYDLKDLSPNELQRYCKSLIADEFLNSKITNIRISKREEKNKPLTLEFDASAPTAVRQQADLYYANIDPYKLFDDMSWLSADRRRYPIRYAYPHTISKAIKVQLNDSYRIRLLPKAINVNTYDLNYMRSYEISSDSEFIFKENYSVKSREIPASEYSGIQLFFSRIQNGSEDRVILSK